MSPRPSRSSIALAVCIAAVALRVQPAAQPTPVPSEVSAVLAHAGSTATNDLSSLQAGRVVVKTQVTPENLDATVLAAVKINSPLERTVAYFRQLISYVDGQATQVFSVVTQPPERADFRDQSLEAADLVDLKGCTTNRCDIRVGAVPVDAVASAIDWTAADANDRANSWMRNALSAMTTDYQRAGNAALRGYDERGAALDMADLWNALESNAVILKTVAPALQQYLGRYPGARPSQAANEFYTDKQHFTSLKPVIGVTHLVTWRDATEPHRVLVVQKQIAATHYFFGSLATTMFVQDSATPPSTYVVYTNQARGDLLRGTQATDQTGLRGRIGNIGASVQRRLGEQMVRQSAETLMSNMKSQLER